MPTLNDLWQVQLSNETAADIAQRLEEMLRGRTFTRITVNEAQSNLLVVDSGLTLSDEPLKAHTMSVPPVFPELSSEVIVKDAEFTEDSVPLGFVAYTTLGKSEAYFWFESRRINARGVDPRGAAWQQVILIED